MASRSQFFRRFIESLQIRDGDSNRLIPFVFNEPQELVWNQHIAPALDAKREIRIILLKARQEGISTLIQGLFTARFIWESYVNMKVIAHEGESTKTIWGMAERMVDQSKFAPMVAKFGTTMELGGSSYSCATAGSPNKTRSMNNTALHDSEVAFWPSPDAWLASRQTVPKRGETWIFDESTANGKVNEGELFYDEWTRAVKGKSKMTPVFLAWFVLKKYSLDGWVYKEKAPANARLVLENLDAEERELKKAFDLTAGQLAWRRMYVEDQCRGNVELFHQEYPSTPEEAFIQSGLPLFRSADLIPFRRDIHEGRKFRIDPDGRFTLDGNGYLTIWKAPEEGHKYLIGADTSMGFDDASHSRSAAEVLDMDTLEQVAEYDCASPTYVMARHLAHMGRRYHNALLAPEITASGGGGGRELLVYLMKDHEYYHVYRNKLVDRIKPDQGHKWGWETNIKTRSRMIARIVEVVKQKVCRIHSEALLTQLQSFGESDSGRYESLAGKDDLLFAFGIACAVWGEEKYHMHLVPDKQKVTREALQGAGFKTQRDPQADWEQAWEDRFHKAEHRETANWMAL